MLLLRQLQTEYFNLACDICHGCQLQPCDVQHVVAAAKVFVICTLMILNPSRDLHCHVPCDHLAACQRLWSALQFK